jgi:DNA-binding transcriptional LysR family regulator
MPDSALQSRLKVQHLITLASVGRHRNAHRAAKELGLSQPAVSKIIREVEDIFAAPLFERGRSGMHPNDIGEALIERAVALLNDLTHIRSDMSAIMAGEIGHLRLGVIAFLSPTVISQTLKAFTAHRMLTLDIREGTTAPFVAQLLRRELDCVIGRYVSESEHELEQRILYQQRFAVVVSKRHPMLTKRRPVTLADTQGYGWIVPPSRTAARQALSALFMDTDLVPPRVNIETSSLEIIKASLVDSTLIGILPTEIARHFGEAAALEILPFAINYQPAPVTLILRRGEKRPPSLERFCQTIIEVSARVAGDAADGKPLPQRNYRTSAKPRSKRPVRVR